MKVIAFVNRKGGVAKTTSAVNIAAALGTRGQRVLLIDLDAGAYACSHLAAADPMTSIADVLLGTATLSEIVVPTTAIGVDLAPSDTSLASASLTLAGLPGRELRLLRAVRAFRKEQAAGPEDQRYDYVLIDCPPELSLLPMNALIAADHFIVPTSPDRFAVQGLAALLYEVAEIEEALGQAAAFGGVIVTMADYRSNVTRDTEIALREQLAGKVFDTVVRVNSRLKEAQNKGLSIFDYDARASAAAAYAALAAEIQEKL